MNVKIILLILYLFLLHKINGANIALLDTTHREIALYIPFINCAHAAGLNISYNGIDQIMDTQDLERSYAHHDALFFIIGVEFLKGLNHSPVSQKIIAFLTQYAKKPNKLIGLIFTPSLHTIQMPLADALPQFFEPLGLDRNNRSNNQERIALSLTVS